MPASQAGRRRFDSGRPLQPASGVTAQAVAPDATARLFDWHSVECPRPPRDTLSPRSVSKLPSWNAHLLAGRRFSACGLACHSPRCCLTHGIMVVPARVPGGWSNRPSHNGPVGDGILALRARRCGLPLCGPLDHVGSVQASWARHARAADGFGEASLLEVHLGHPATRSPWPDRNCASVPDEGEVARPPLTGELRRKCARLTKSDGTTRDRAFSHANFNGAIAGCRGLRGSSWEVRDNLRTEVLRGWARELRWCLGLAPWRDTLSRRVFAISRPG
jgi:hypothetical protein